MSSCSLLLLLSTVMILTFQLASGSEVEHWEALHLKLLANWIILYWLLIPNINFIEKFFQQTIVQIMDELYKEGFREKD